MAFLLVAEMSALGDHISNMGHPLATIANVTGHVVSTSYVAASIIGGLSPNDVMIILCSVWYAGSLSVMAYRLIKWLRS